MKYWVLIVVFYGTPNNEIVTVTFYGPNALAACYDARAAVVRSPAKRVKSALCAYSDVKRTPVPQIDPYLGLEP